MGIEWSLWDIFFILRRELKVGKLLILIVVDRGDMGKRKKDIEWYLCFFILG